MRRLGEFGVDVRWRKSNLASVRLLLSQDAYTDGRTIRTITDAAPTLPSTFATHLVLPALLTSLTHTTMSVSAPSIIPLVIQLGAYVLSDEYKSLVLEPVIKLFANPDRGTRMAILEVLPEFADKLDKQTVSEKIWPHLVSISTIVIQI
jgi:SCY1-like protein 1